VNSWLGLLQQGFFFSTVVVVMAALATAAVYPLLTRRLAALPAATRSSLAFGLCLLPLATAVLVLVSALLPSLLQLAGLGTDHCLGHDDGHVHFCLVHRPVLIVCLATNAITDWQQSRRFKAVLNQYRMISGSDDISILATPTPLAFSFGILNPRIVLSTGLLATLSPLEQQIVIAHETTHRSRRDSLRRLLARSLSLAHLPSVRKSLLGMLQLADEQVCDAAAADIAGDASLVATLLLKLERLYQQHFPLQNTLALNVLGESTSSLPQRIEALLAPPAVRSSQWWPLVLACSLLLALIGDHDFVHDSLEHVLAIVTNEG
jgi:Zn-dependent protease with chaperone function